MKDLYSVLEVNPRARPAVIDAAYRALMKDHHPDMGKSGRTAKDLNEAHDVLSNNDKRRSYDRDINHIDGKKIGPYKIIEQIAEGGFGRTYKAKHTGIDELVCIKDCFNISPQDTQMLIEEAKATWDLRHYAIPAIRDLIKMPDGRVLLVMSYIPGDTLHKLIEKYGPLDAESVSWIAQRVTNAFDYIHRHGVVHGDVKPQNIIVQPDKHAAVLVDFGLSAVKPTHTSESKGYTPFYAPPEEIAGKPLIPESDYFSLGMTMIYALSGNTEHLEQKQIPRDTPEPLANFIKQLIARDVNARPQYGRQDLGDIIVEVRKKAFGRDRSGMKPIHRR